MISSSSSGPAANTGYGGHCSINHGGGSGGLGPVMEIREMSGYCVPPPDKYYHAHHHHGTVPIVSGASTARHSGVYHPQVFYTPPPPAPPTYPTSNATTAPPDWSSCPPPPPPGAPETFSHFMYPHHQYSQASQHHHHHHHPSDYGNFLGLPATSCYEQDIVMMSAGAQSQSLPPPSSPISLTPGNSNILEGQIGIGTVSSSIMTMTSSFLYPKPPSSTTIYHPLDHSSASVPALSIISDKNPSKLPSVSILTSPSPNSSSSIEDSDLEEEDDDNDDDKQVICIEDDEIIISSLETSQESALCMLCKKPASVAQASTTSTHPHCSSPQLAKILENIDDDELDISVCSDDIEIGGIEDEMMQAEQTQNLFKITVSNLAQLINIAPSTLLAGMQQLDEEQEATLCSKCHKFVGMAESLEKQLSSVLSTLRQTMDIVDENISQKIKHQTSTVAIQTDPISFEERVKPSRIFVVRNGSSTLHPLVYPPKNIIVPGDTHHGVTLGKTFLCHTCGRTFNCGRNLGKHLKRHHNQEIGAPIKIPCTREDCTTKCSDITALQNHMKVHNGDKSYFCKNCLKLFSTKSNLVAHINTEICREKNHKVKNVLPEEDENGGSNGFRCENCGLSFRTEKRFLRHAHSKTKCNKSKTFGCDSCNKVFAKASELRGHQAVHTGTKCFTCDVCGLGFTTRGNQRVHQRTHFNENRFKCQFCGKAFTRNQTLQTHYTNNHPTDTVMNE